MNRLRAAWNRLVALWHSRWERPEPRHTARLAEPAEPPAEPEDVPPAQLTQMDFPPPVSRVPPYIKHRHRRPK